MNEIAIADAAWLAAWLDKELGKENRGHLIPRYVSALRAMKPEDGVAFLAYANLTAGFQMPGLPK